jgi:ABC-2 type transport system ATP-binding protein
VPAVEVEHLTIRYGDVTAVDDVSFAADAGAVTVLLGPNGAGKTSTIECLEGYRSATSGRIRVCGLDPVSDHTAVTHRIGVMLQDGGVYTGIRPPEVLRLFAAYYDDPVDPDELLELVGLDHRRRSTWRSLSGGEQQRLSLALALVGRPEVAFLDEPTAGVDLQGRQLIRQLISSLRDRGVAVLLTTHDLEDAEMLADRIVIIDAGTVVADGSPMELLSVHDAPDFHFRAEPNLDVVGLGVAVGAPVIEELPGAYRVDATPTPENVAAVTAWLAQHGELLGDLRAGRQRLDEVFARLTGERSEARESRGGGRRRRRDDRGGDGRGDSTADDARSTA